MYAKNIECVINIFEYILYTEDGQVYIIIRCMDANFNTNSSQILTVFYCITRSKIIYHFWILYI